MKILRVFCFKDVRKIKNIPHNLLTITLYIAIVIIVLGLKTWPCPLYKATFYGNLISSGAVLNLDPKVSFKIRKGYLTSLSNSIENTHVATEALQVERTTIEDLQPYVSKTGSLCIYPKKGSHFILEVLKDQQKSKRIPISITLSNNRSDVPIKFRFDQLETYGDISLEISKTAGIKTIEIESLEKFKITLANATIKFGGQLISIGNDNKEIYGQSKSHTITFVQGPIKEKDLEPCWADTKSVPQFKKSRTREDELITLKFGNVFYEDFPSIEFEKQTEAEKIGVDFTMKSMKKGHIKISGQKEIIDIEKISKFPTDGKISGPVTEIAAFNVTREGLNMYFSGKTDSIIILNEQKLQKWLDYVLSYKAFSIIIGLLIIMFDKILTYMSATLNNKTSKPEEGEEGSPEGGDGNREIDPEVATPKTK